MKKFIIYAAILGALSYSLTGAASASISGAPARIEAALSAAGV